MIKVLESKKDEIVNNEYMFIPKRQKGKFKEGFFANHTPKTRKLTCPACGKKSFCIETSVDELNK